MGMMSVALQWSGREFPEAFRAFALRIKEVSPPSDMGQQYRYGVVEGDESNGVFDRLPDNYIVRTSLKRVTGSSLPYGCFGESGLYSSVKVVVCPLLNGQQEVYVIGRTPEQVKRVMKDLLSEDPTYPFHDCAPGRSFQEDLKLLADVRTRMREAVGEALRQNNGNEALAAKMLGCTTELLRQIALGCP
jgi:hypothetical protein